MFIFPKNNVHKLLTTPNILIQNMSHSSNNAHDFRRCEQVFINSLLTIHIIIKSY